MENLNSDGDFQPTFSDEGSSQSFCSPLVETKIHSQVLLTTDPDQQEKIQPCKNDEAFSEEDSSERIIETDEAEPEYQDLFLRNNTDQVENEEIKGDQRDEDLPITSRSPNRQPKIKEEEAIGSQNLNQSKSSNSSLIDKEDNEDKNCVSDSVDHFAQLFDTDHNLNDLQNSVQDNGLIENLHSELSLNNDEVNQIAIDELEITDCNNFNKTKLTANQIKTQENEEKSVEEDEQEEDYYDGDEIIDIGDDIQPFSMNSFKNQEENKVNLINANEDIQPRYLKEQNVQSFNTIQSAEQKQDIQSQDTKLNDLSEFEKLFGLQERAENAHQSNTDPLSLATVDSIFKDSTNSNHHQNLLDQPHVMQEKYETQNQQQSLDNQDNEFERSDEEQIDERNDSDIIERESEPIPQYEQDDYDPYANSMMFKSFKIKPGQILTCGINVNQSKEKQSKYQQDFANEEDNEDQFDLRDEENQDQNDLQDDKQESKINVFLNNFAQMQNHQRNQGKGKRQAYGLDFEEIGELKQSIGENDDYNQMQDEDILDNNQGEEIDDIQKAQNLEEIAEIDRSDLNAINEEGMMNSFEVRLNSQEQNDGSGLFNDSFTSSQEQKDASNKIEIDKVNPQQIQNKKNITNYEPLKNGEVSQQKLPQSINLFSFDNEVDINIVDDNSYDDEEEQNMREDIQSEELQIQDQFNLKQYDISYERTKPQRAEINFTRDAQLSDEEYDQDSFEEEGFNGEQITQPQLKPIQTSDQDQLINSSINDKESSLELERDEDERSERIDEENSEKSPVYDQAMFSRFSSTFKFNPGEFNQIKSGIQEPTSSSKPQQQDADIYNKRNEITYNSENPFGDVDRFDFQDFQPIRDDTFEEDDDNEAFNFKSRGSPSKNRSQSDNMNQGKSKQIDAKIDITQSVSIQNLAIVKGGVNQNIDIRKAVQVDKFIDSNTQKQISLSQRQEVHREQEYIPEMLTDSSVEIIKQTKHDQFYNFFDDKDNNQNSQESIQNEAQNFFDFFGGSNDQDSSRTQTEKSDNQNRYRLGRQQEANLNDDAEDEDEDDEFDRDEEGSRDKDLDELFGFESQAKKKEREQKLQEDQDDGMNKKSCNTLESGDWFTLQKLDGWKIIDGARPDHESQEKSRAEDLQLTNLNIKPHQSKRIALIMEGIFQNMIRNQNKNLKIQINPPKKKGKQPPKAQYRSQKFEIQFGKIFASGTLTIIISSISLEENIQDLLKIGQRRFKRSLAEKERALNLAKLKTQSIILPKLRQLVFEYTDSYYSCEQLDCFQDAEFCFSIQFQELRLENDHHSFQNEREQIIYYKEHFIKIQTILEIVQALSAEEQEKIQFQKCQRPINQLQYEEFFRLKLKQFRSNQQICEEKEAKEQSQLEDNNNLSRFQDHDNRLIENIITPIKSEQKVNDRNLLSEDRTTTTQNEDYMPFDVSLDQIYGSPSHPMQLAKQSSSVNRSMSSQSSSQQSFMNTAQVNQTANRKLKISRKSIQFINHLAQKESRDKREPKNQDEVPQHQLKYENSSLPSQPQVSIPSSQAILRDTSIKEDKLSNQKQIIGGQKQQQLLKFSNQNNLDKVPQRGSSQSISNSKVHENLQRVLLIKPNASQGISNSGGQKVTTPQKIILKTVTKSIQNRISDIHQVDSKMLQIRKNVRALNLNAQSPNSPNLNKNQSQQINPHFTIGQDPQVEQDFQGLKKILMTNTRHKVDIFKSADPNSIKDTKSQQHQRTSQSFNKINNILKSKVNTSVVNQGENQVNLSLISQVASKFEKIKPLRLQSKGKVTSNQSTSVFSRLSQGLSSQQKPLMIQDFEDQKIEDARNSEPFHRYGNENLKIKPQDESSLKIRVPRQIATKSDYEASKEEESLDEIRLNESNIPLLYGSHQSSLHSQSVPEYGVPTSGLEYKHTFLSNQGSNSIPEIRTFSEGSGSPQSVNRPLKLRGNEFKKEDILKVLKDKSPTKPQMLNNFISQDDQQ